LIAPAQAAPIETKVLEQENVTGGARLHAPSLHAAGEAGDDATPRLWVDLPDDGILRHLGKFRKILSPPRCADFVVRRPIAARKRRVVEPDVHTGGLYVFTTPAKTERENLWIWRFA
jgi:hypothetical protein